MLHVVPHGYGRYLLAALLGSSLLFSGLSLAETEPTTGQMLAFTTEQGNCLACHHIPGGSQMGDIGPALENMRARFPDRTRLYRQIWDASAFNPETLMPPYGRHEILSPTEIDAIIDFLYRH
ncbi:MAG: sulfur oxidation c-type cytochrome SoxX [Pseudomonadota bacterium]